MTYYPYIVLYLQKLTENPEKFKVICAKLGTKEANNGHNSYWKNYGKSIINWDALDKLIYHPTNVGKEGRPSKINNNNKDNKKLFCMDNRTHFVVFNGKNPVEKEADHFALRRLETLKALLLDRASGDGDDISHAHEMIDWTETIARLNRMDEVDEVGEGDMLKDLGQFADLMETAAAWEQKDFKNITKFPCLN